MKPLILAVVLLTIAVGLAFYACNNQEPEKAAAPAATATALISASHPTPAGPAELPDVKAETGFVAETPYTAEAETAYEAPVPAEAPEPAPEATDTPEPAGFPEGTTHAFEYQGGFYRVGVSEQPPGIVSIKLRDPQSNRWMELLDFRSPSAPFAMVRGRPRLTLVSAAEVKRENDGARLIFRDVATSDPRIRFDWELDFTQESFTTHFSWTYKGESPIQDNLPDVREVGFVFYALGSGTETSDFERPGIKQPAPRWAAWDRNNLRVTVEPASGGWQRAETFEGAATLSYYSLWNADGASIPMGTWEAGSLRVSFMDASSVAREAWMPRWDPAGKAWVQEGDLFVVPYKAELAGGGLLALADYNGIAALHAGDPREATGSILGPAPLTFHLTTEEPGLDLIPQERRGRFAVQPGLLHYEGAGTRPGAKNGSRWSVDWFTPEDGRLLLALVTWKDTDDGWKPRLRPNFVLRAAGEAELPSGTATVSRHAIRWMTRDFVRDGNEWKAVFGLVAAPTEKQELLSSSIAILEATEYLAWVKGQRERLDFFRQMQTPEWNLAGLASFGVSAALAARSQPLNGIALIQQDRSAGWGRLTESALVDTACLATGAVGAVVEDLVHYASRQSSGGNIPLEVSASEVRAPSPALSGAAFILRLDQYIAWTGDRDILNRTVSKPEGTNESLLTVCRRSADGQMPELIRTDASQLTGNRLKIAMAWQRALEALAAGCNQNNLPGEARRYSEAADLLLNRVNDAMNKGGLTSGANPAFAASPVIWSVLLGFNPEGKGVDALESSRVTPYGVRERANDDARADLTCLAALGLIQRGEPQKALLLLNRMIPPILNHGRQPPRASDPPWVIPQSFKTETGETIGESAAAGALLYRVLLEGFCGVQSTREGLRFEPRLPPEWRNQDVRAPFKWRGRTIDLNIRDEGRGTPSIQINGHAQPPGFLFDETTLPDRAIVEIKM